MACSVKIAWYCKNKFINQVIFPVTPELGSRLLFLMIYSSEQLVKQLGEVHSKDVGMPPLLFYFSFIFLPLSHLPLNFNQGCCIKMSLVLVRPLWPVEKFCNILQLFTALCSCENVMWRFQDGSSMLCVWIEPLIQVVTYMF